MNKRDYNRLVEEYGLVAATRAKDWLIANSTTAFRNAVNQYKFIVSNEYLWFNN